MGYLDQAALAQDNDFRTRMQIGMIKVALEVVGEARPGEANGFYAYYNKRHELGTGVLTNPGAFVDRFAWATVTNSVITAASIDGDLEYMVVTIWDDLAGVSADELPS